MAIGSTWFTNTDQYNLFKSNAERALLIVKQAQATRMEADIAALNEKYDGKKAAAIEEEINGLYAQKGDVATYLTGVETGVKRLDDVRTQLLAAQDAIAKGSGSAFDLAINSMNLWIGRQVNNTDSVIANNGNNSGYWAADTQVLSGGGMSVAVSHQFMGSDYALVFSDGSVSRPERDGNTMTGGLLDGTNMSELTLSVDDSGNYSLVNPKTGLTEPVEVRRGGLGVLNAWGYGDLTRPDDGFDPTVPLVIDPADPDPAATTAAYNENMTRYKNRERANADITTAFKKLAQIERNLNSYEAGLSGIVNALDSKSERLTDEYQKISEEELTAKQAERRAIETKFNIATNSLALASESMSTMIYQMFNNSATTTKKTLTDVLLGSVTGS